MGCVTSKHLKKQAVCDGWTSLASRTSHISVEYYHHHSVSLTSTTYGSLKVDSPKHLPAPVPSRNEIYGTLRPLEKENSAHGTTDAGNSRNGRSPPHSHSGNHIERDDREAAAPDASPLSRRITDNYHDSEAMEGTVNRTVSPVGFSLYESPPLALQSSPSWSMSSAELGLPETINVKEMMMGLEEAAPLSKHSSPAKRSHSNTNTKVLQQHNKNLKRKAEDLPKITYDACTVKKGVAATFKGWSKEDAGSGKENTSPLHYPSKMTASTGRPVSKRPLSQASNVSYMSSVRTGEACIPMASSPLSHLATVKPAQRVELHRRTENIATRKAACERGQSFIHSQNEKSSPGLSSASMASMQSVHYAPSNGKVMLSLINNQSDQSASIVTPSPPPDRSMSRRLVLAEGDLHSSEITSPTFDPELVASYEKALSDVSQVQWNATHLNTPRSNSCFSAETSVTHGGQPWRWSSVSRPVAELDRRLYNPLECFDEKCPPGGGNSLVLYTTTLHGIRKTFEDCNMAREILDSFNLSIDERDVSMHLEFLNELRELMGRVVSVPRLFISGRYIGGIEMVVRLHEDGKLRELIEGLPKRRDAGTCEGCGGIRFVPCLECCGSCKLRCEDDDRVIRCPDCNENGLIQCPICT